MIVVGIEIAAVVVEEMDPSLKLRCYCFVMSYTVVVEEFVVVVEVKCVVVEMSSSLKSYYHYYY